MREKQKSGVKNRRSKGSAGIGGLLATAAQTPDPGLANLQEQHRIASDLLASGMSMARCCRAMAERFDSTPKAMREILREVMEGWRDTLLEDQPLLKASAAERLRRDLARMRGSPNPSWNAIRAHEALLADIEGTKDPIRVKVDVGVEVRQSLVAIIADMTPEQIEHLVTEQLALEAMTHRTGATSVVSAASGKRVSQ